MIIDGKISALHFPFLFPACLIRKIPAAADDRTEKSTSDVYHRAAFQETTERQDYKSAIDRCVCVCRSGAAEQHNFYKNIVYVAGKGGTNCQLLCEIQSKLNGAFEGTQCLVEG